MEIGKMWRSQFRVFRCWRPLGAGVDARTIVMNAEKIHGKNHYLLAIYVSRQITDACEGVQFHTSPEDQLQLASMSQPKGYTVKSHTHEGGARTVYKTQEVLIVLKGKLQVTIHDRDGELWCHLTVSDGESILLMDGGHAVKCLEDTMFVEVKQGPYLGKDDKRYLLDNGDVQLWEGGPTV